MNTKTWHPNDVIELIDWNRLSDEVTIVIFHGLCIRFSASVVSIDVPETNGGGTEDRVQLADRFHYVDEETGENIGNWQDFTCGLSEQLEDFLQGKLDR